MLLYLGNWGYSHFTLPQGLDIVGAWARICARVESRAVVARVPLVGVCGSSGRHRYHAGEA